MIDPQSEATTKRFFKALRRLIRDGKLEHKTEFVWRYDIDRRNFRKVEKTPDAISVRIAWLHHMVKDYGISGDWLLAGKGKMYRQ